MLHAASCLGITLICDGDCRLESQIEKVSRLMRLETEHSVVSENSLRAQMAAKFAQLMEWANHIGTAWHSEWQQASRLSRIILPISTWRSKVDSSKDIFKPPTSLTLGLRVRCRNRVLVRATAPPKAIPCFPASSSCLCVNFVFPHTTPILLAILLCSASDHAVTAGGANVVRRNRVDCAGFIKHTPFPLCSRV